MIRTAQALNRRDVLRGGLGTLMGAAVVGAVGCSGENGANGNGAGADPHTVAIASGYGLSFASLTIIESLGWLAEDLPDHTIEWEVLSGGSASRDGLLADTLQVGSGGLAPFLQARDSGVPWKIVTGLNNMPLWMVTLEDRIQSLADITEDDSISSPQPGSIQSIVLAHAADQEFGDPDRFTNNLVAMPHPDALQSLVSGQIAAAVSSPPFQYQAEAEGARVLLDSYEVFGAAHGFNVVSALEDYVEANPDVIEALHAAVERANELISDDPEQAAEILSEAEDGEVSTEEYLDYLGRDGIEFTSTPQGLELVGGVMAGIGDIDAAPEDWTEVVFDTVAGQDGS